MTLTHSYLCHTQKHTHAKTQLGKHLQLWTPIALLLFVLKLFGNYLH